MKRKNQVEKIKDLRNELEVLKNSHTGIELDNAFKLLKDIEDEFLMGQSKDFFAEFEHSMQFIIDSISFRLFWKDLSLNIIGSNRVFKELLKNGEEEKKLQEAINKEGVKYDKEIQQGIRESVTFRYIYQNKFSERKVFRIEKIALFNPNHELVGILETQIDLTYQHNLKDRIFEVNRLLFSVLNSIPYAVFWKDKDFKFKYVNKRFLEILGYNSINDVVGKTDVELSWSDRAESYVEVDLNLRESKQPLLDLEEFIIKGNGDRIWLRTSKAPILDEKGNFQGIIGVLDDITQSQFMKMALRHSEARLKSYYNCSTDGIIVLNQNLEIRDINMAIESIFAYNQNFFKGKVLFDLFTNDASLIEFKEKCSQLSMDSVSGKCVAVDRENNLRYLNLDLIYIEVDHYICLVRDITELQLAIKRAEESNSLKTAFLQNISHEIRTPLNAIIGFSNLLLLHMYESEKELDHFLQIVYNNSEFLLGLVNSVIDLSKIEADQTNLVENSICLSSFIKNEILPVIVSERDRLHKINVDINMKLEDVSENVMMVVDAYRLKQIIVNLMHNALKFTEKGSVDLKVNKEGEKISFTVTDTGIGINKEQINKIFHRFYKVNDPNMVSVGSGLGLAIVKKLLRLMGGSIEVESEVDRGSQFIFTLPVEPN